jgi:hypothetical protein
MKQFLKVWNSYSKYERAKIGFCGFLCAIGFYILAVIGLIL